VRAGHTARGRLRKGAQFDLRRSGAPPPSREAKEGRARAREKGQAELTSAHSCAETATRAPISRNGAKPDERIQAETVQAQTIRVGATEA
jgi:hypothetical protein